MLYSRGELSDSLQPSEADWEPSRRYFETHRVREDEIGEWGAWKGWSHELDGVRLTLESELSIWITDCVSRTIRIFRIRTQRYTFHICCEY